MNNKVKLSKVATAADVSQATASRVFSGHPYISNEIRRKVIRCASELGYIPRRSHGKPVIAVIVESYETFVIDAYFNMILANVSMQIAKRGYGMELVTNAEGARLKNPVSGIISLVAYPGYLKCIDDEPGVPVVAINSRLSTVQSQYSVNSDEAQGIGIAVEYLKNRNHHRPGLIIYGEKDNYNNNLRKEQFLRSVKASGLEAVESAVRYVSYPENYIENLGKLLKTGITALICAGEAVALETAYALDLFGRRIPDDISLISFENRNMSCFYSPPHTTVSQDFEKLCSTALDIIEKPAGRQRTVLVEYSLIERESVRTLKGGR